jgi:hypothetical protein
LLPDAEAGGTITRVGFGEAWDRRAHWDPVNTNKDFVESFALTKSSAKRSTRECFVRTGLEKCPGFMASLLSSIDIIN